MIITLKKSAQLLGKAAWAWRARWAAGWGCLCRCRCRCRDALRFVEMSFRSRNIYIRVIDCIYAYIYINIYMCVCGLICGLR